MTTEMILERLTTDVGRPLARMADPSYWSCEYRDRATMYAKALTATRNCYRRIRSGSDPKAELTALKRTVFGIEGNAISRILDDMESK